MLEVPQHLCGSPGGRRVTFLLRHRCLSCPSLWLPGGPPQSHHDGGGAGAWTCRVCREQAGTSGRALSPRSQQA